MSDVTIHQDPAYAACPTTVRADVQRLLVALVKLALVDEGKHTATWHADARDAQQRVVAAADVAAVHLDGLWAIAVRTAESDPMIQRDETVNPMLPTMSPVGLQALTADPFNLEGAVQTIRDAASFG